jgi:hypothetical protein
MKVINLRCTHGHAFEGWFGSDDDFLDQNGRGLVECPLCADKVIQRTPSAPRLNLSGARAEESAPKAAITAPSEDMQARFLRAVRHVMAHTEDVGAQFADEARRIHYGESPERGIRGQASAEDREALRDEGIDVHPLPIPTALKDTLQ